MKRVRKSTAGVWQLTGSEIVTRSEPRDGERPRSLNRSRDRPDWPLVGREDELATVIRLLADGVGAVRTVVLTGPPGTGRTRMAREASWAAMSRGHLVRWATATRVTRPIPLGALAHLIATRPPVMDGFAVLQQAAFELSDDGVDRSVVVVDDAHQLDELSVALLHQLVVAGATTIVLTAPTDALPDWIGDLCKDAMAVRLDLGPLTREQGDRLMAAALDGVVEARTAERCWQLTLGNPQFLRGLLDSGCGDGSLRLRDGLWTWDGEITLAPPMVELVCGRLGDVAPDERQLIEALATAGPIRADDLVALGSRGGVAALERRGLVTVRRGLARLAHPLHAIAVRSRMPESDAQWMRDRIVRMADPDGAGLSGDRLLQLIEHWPGHDGVPAGDEQLVRAAELANARLDHVVAERLARAVGPAGGGRARLALIEAVQWQGRPAEVEELATAGGPRVGTDRERSRLGVLRAVNLFCGLGRPLAAAQVLDETARTVTHADDRHALVSTRAVLALLAGDGRAAIELGREVLRAEVGAGRPLAAAAVGGGLALLGRSEEALSTIATGWARLESSGGDAVDGMYTAFARLALSQAEVVTLMLACRFDELGARTRELHAGCMGAPQGIGDAVAALHRGWADLAVGRVGHARIWMRQAVSGLSRADPVGLLPVAGSQLAVTEALLGDPRRARTTLRETGADAPADLRMELFTPFRMLAEAWIRAAEGRDGGAVALDVAAAAESGGRAGIELTALHIAARMGRAAQAGPRLGVLADTIGGPQSAALAQHAVASAAADGDALERAAGAFVEQGALLRAADAVAQAATAYDGEGDRRHAASARAHAQALARECEVDAATPALRGLVGPELTGREDEVARMAARGLNNQAIASRLVVSVRTVETHLAKVYVKLGINGRRELTATLLPGPTDRLTRKHA